MKTGIVICSYNMPEYTDALVEHIRDTVKQPYALMVFDNGSDLVEPSKYTTYHEPANIQMVPGFMKALRVLTSDEALDAYWFITTSCRFDPEDRRDPLELLLERLREPDTYAAQPSLIIDEGAWKDYLAPVTGAWREVHSLENNATAFRADNFDRLGRWREELIYGWGIAAESFYKAREAGLKSWSHDGYTMFKDTFVGYKMDRMNMTGEQRSELSSQRASDVLDPIYGHPWWKTLNRGLNWKTAGGIYA